MRYFVTGGDGKTYGPVEVDTLRQWILEGRVSPDTDLREESSGLHVKAGQVEALHEAWQEAGSSPSGVYPHPACRNCGFPFDHGANRVCPNCGAAAALSHEGKLMTGSEWGDRILGFVGGIASYFVFGIGSVVALVLYFVLRPTYPKFCRGLMAGLATVMVILLGLFAVCIVSLSSMH